MTLQKTHKSASSSKADIIHLLKEDHKTVKALFEEFEALKEKGNSNAKKDKIVKKLCEELTLHALLEESIVYPVAREIIGDEDVMDEADIEHAGVKELISQLESMNSDESHFDAKVTVLKEYVEHHVKEEESRILAKLAKADIDALALAEEAIEFKDSHKKDLKAKESTKKQSEKASHSRSSASTAHKA